MSTIKTNCPRCGRSRQSVCAEKWQEDYVKNHTHGKLCDSCLIYEQNHTHGFVISNDKDDIMVRANDEARELHEQQKANKWIEANV